MAMAAWSAKVVHQLYLFLSKWVHLCAGEREGTDRRSFTQERDGKVSSVSGNPDSQSRGIPDRLTRPEYESACPPMRLAQ